MRYMCPPSQDNIVGRGLPGLAAATFEPRWSLGFDCHYGQFLSCRPFATQDPCAPTTHLQMDRHEAKWTYHRNWLVVSNNVSFLTGNDTNQLFLSLRLLPQDGPRCLHLKDLRRRSCYQQVTEPTWCHGGQDSSFKRTADLGPSLVNISKPSYPSTDATIPTGCEHHFLPEKMLSHE